MIRRFINNYVPRHRNRVNQFLHLLGVPLTFIGTPICIVEDLAWYYPLGCFLAGYALQFAGHAIEGNDAGEVVFVKKKLGLPYTEYAPGANPSSDSDNHDDTSAV